MENDLKMLQDLQATAGAAVQGDLAHFASEYEAARAVVDKGI